MSYMVVLNGRMTKQNHNRQHRFKTHAQRSQPFSAHRGLRLLRALRLRLAAQITEPMRQAEFDYSYR